MYLFVEELKRRREEGRVPEKRRGRSSMVMAAGRRGSRSARGGAGGDRRRWRPRSGEVEAMVRGCHGGPNTGWVEAASK